MQAGVDAGTGQGLPPAAVQRRAEDRTALVGLEDQPILTGREGCQVGRELVDDERRQRHRPHALGRPRRAEERGPAGDVDELPVDTDFSAQEVDNVDVEPEHLT